MNIGTDSNGGDTDDQSTSQIVTKWTKGVPDPTNDRINHWSLNGFGEPVFTGGLYSSEETRTLEATVKDYCASKNVTPAELCSENHNKAVRGAWHEIAQCLPHRTVLSVYRRSLRQFSGHTRGQWTDEEVSSLFRLVDLHGQKWKTIQDKLGRSAHNCRAKYYDLQDEFERGRWSMEKLELLLSTVRQVLDVPRDDMDVREINQWTLDNHSKIPWTIISFRVMRARVDCYFKWKAMTKRSNKLASRMGLEQVPMARCTLKFDVKTEYYLWKAEQDPKWRKKYADKFILLQSESNLQDSQMQLDNVLLGSIVQCKASRSSEMPWNTLRDMPNGMTARERFDHLVDTYASENEMDLPLWELAKLVKSSLNKFASEGSDLMTDASLHAKGRHAPGDKPYQTKSKR